MTKKFQRLLRPLASAARERWRRVIPYAISGGITTRVSVAAIAAVAIFGAATLTTTAPRTAPVIGVAEVTPAPPVIPTAKSDEIRRPVDTPRALPRALPNALPSAPRIVDLKPLLANLQHYQDSIQEGLADDSEASRAAIDKARTDLNNAVQSLHTQPDGRSRALAAMLSGALSDYQSHGSDLVSTANRRRAAIKEYANLVESLAARVDTAINNTNGLLGKLFDRTPLIQLRADLSDVARGPSILHDAQGPGDPMLLAVLTSERRTLATLDAQQKALRHSQGNIWFESMQADIARLPTLRDAVLNAGVMLRAHRIAFEQQSTSLKALIPSEIQIARATPPPL